MRVTKNVTVRYVGVEVLIFLLKKLDTVVQKTCHVCQQPCFSQTNCGRANSCRREVGYYLRWTVTNK